MQQTDKTFCVAWVYHWVDGGAIIRVVHRQRGDGKTQCGIEIRPHWGLDFAENEDGYNCPRCKKRQPESEEENERRTLNS